MMEDSTKDLIQNEDVAPHPGELQQVEIDYTPSKRIKIKF